MACKEEGWRPKRKGKGWCLVGRDGARRGGFGVDRLGLAAGECEKEG